MTGDAGDAGDGGSWAASALRASGLLLVGLASWRFAADHLLTPAGDVTSFTVERRLGDPTWRLAEWSFLTLALVHGMVGVHWTIRRRVRGATTRLAVEAVGGAFVGVLFVASSLVLFAG